MKLNEFLGTTWQIHHEAKHEEELFMPIKKQMLIEIYCTFSGW